MNKKQLVRLLKKNKYVKSTIKYFINKKNKYDYKRACKCNNINENMVIFESFLGRKYADSPRAIYEEMIQDARFKDFIFVWSFTDPKEKISVPELSRAILVSHHSKKYYEYYSKAKYFVSNSRLDEIIQKRDGQVYIQTWHGTPLKRLGYDIPVGNNTLHSKEALCHLYKIDSERYTYLLSPSKFCTERFSSAFNLPENSPNVEIVEEGYPRNDFLTNYTDADVVRIRKALGIEHFNKKIILYAPTWRDNQYSNGDYSYKVEVDFSKLQEQLSDEYIILFRAHYFVANAFDFSKYKGFIYNVSEYDNINDLYVIADTLITDYSSVFFDYSILKRPIIFYMYDLENYRNEIRGFYISLDDLPGAIVETEDELVKEIKKEFEYDERYRAFNERFTSLEDGKASRRVVERCFKKN